MPIQQWRMAVTVCSTGQPDAAKSLTFGASQIQLKRLIARVMGGFLLSTKN